MEEGRKRLRRDDASCSASGDVSRRGGGDGDSDSDDDIMAWLSMDDSSAGELMELLEPEMPSPVKMKFIDNPYLSTFVFQPSASYVTINGNEESCGSSFSDSEASIMASVDMAGAAVLPLSLCAAPLDFQAVSGGRVGWSLDQSAWALHADGFEGLDWFDWGDDLLAKVLGEDLCVDALDNQE